MKPVPGHIKRLAVGMSFSFMKLESVLIFDRNIYPIQFVFRA